MKYKAAFFDLDGTLLNTLTDLANASNTVCRNHGFPTFTEEEYKPFLGFGVTHLVRCFTPDHVQGEAFEQVIEEYKRTYGAHSREKTRPYDGIAEVLKALRAAGLKTSVFSNKDDGPSKDTIAEYLPGLFDHVQGKKPDVPVKPDATGLRQSMELLGVKPEECLFIGDSDVDIFTGHNGGMKACGVTWGFRDHDNLQAAGADFIVDTPDQLLSILLGK